MGAVQETVVEASSPSVADTLVGESGAVGVGGSVIVGALGVIESDTELDRLVPIALVVVTVNV